MSESIKIAIVEDDEGLCDLLSRRLEREGHKCVKLRSAASALAWFAENTADLMLLDLKLPDSTGEELITALHVKNINIPFIVTTGQGSETTAVRLLKQGARDYLVKNSSMLESLPATIEMVWREIQLENLLAKAREHIRLQNATLSTINEFEPDGILAIRSDCTVASCNSALMAAWELTEKDVEKGAMHLLSAIAAKTTAPNAFMKAILEVKPDFKGVVLEEIRSGERHFEVFSSPMENGRIWFFHDFSLHKRAEEKLLAAKAEAEANALARSRFFAVVSHDVRTPLNSISGFVSLLEATTLTDTQRDCVTVIKSSCEHLLVLINDILDLSKFEHGAIELCYEEVSPSLILEESLETFIPASTESGVVLQKEIAAEVPEKIEADPLRLRQVLINLLGNAMKFTRHGAVTAACRPAPGQKGLLEFKIRDTGIGISKEVQAFLFEPFVQASADITKQYGGTGLGLAISKQLVERMGGTLQLESEIGRGSTFTFTIPVVQPNKECQ